MDITAQYSTKINSVGTSKNYTISNFCPGTVTSASSATTLICIASVAPFPTLNGQIDSHGGKQLCTPHLFNGRYPLFVRGCVPSKQEEIWAATPKWRTERVVGTLRRCSMLGTLATCEASVISTSYNSKEKKKRRYKSRLLLSFVLWLEGGTACKKRKCITRLAVSAKQPHSVHCLSTSCYILISF